MAKALGSSHSPLIRKRTGVKAEPCATVARPTSDPEVGTGDVDASKVARTNGGLSTEVGATTHGGETTAAKDGVETTAVKDMDSGEERDRSRAAVTSLVADYSDSDSEPGQ